jgi:hypothetical protein
MPAHEHLSGIQFLKGLHPSLGGTKVPEVITGRVARHVFERADIVQSKADAPHIAGATEGYGEGRGYPWGTAHTSQGHLHVPTLNRYARGDIPEYDEDYASDEGESDVPYEPETYEYGGKTWIAEGHHRIVADRLR